MTQEATVWTGLDIGGANLKAASSTGARTLPFPLWKAPHHLAEKLHELLDGYTTNQLAVTMTGELCDCFASKAEGVITILRAVAHAFPRSQVRVWTMAGSFVDLAHAIDDPLPVAAANWLALAYLAADATDGDPGLLIDIGSTTTDIVPLYDSLPCPVGRTDRERLFSGELVYTGVRRTPLCALVWPSVAAEWFATTLDMNLALDLLPENPHDRDTADGRPAIRAAAHGRLAHMLCGDAASCSVEMTRELATRALDVQVSHIATAVERVARTLPELPRVVIVSGAGEFLARRVLQRVILLSRPRVVSLAERFGTAVSEAACAYALAHLAERQS